MSAEWVAASATGVGAAAGVVAVVVYVLQTLVARSARSAQGIVAAIGVLNSTEAQAARHRARSGKTAAEVQHWNQEQRDWATLVCNTYDLAGILVARKVVPEEVVLDDWGPSIEHQWEKFTALIEERRASGSGETHWKNFEHLYNRALQRKLRRHA
jgi:hypothetical protein